MIIRAYKDSDYETIASWWTQAGEIGPLPGMMVEDGTFVVEIDGKPVMSQSVWLTQSKCIALFELFIRDPNTKLPKDVGAKLWQHCFQYAKSRGYNFCITYSKEPRLTERLESFGMNKSLSGLQGLWKEL